MKIYNFEQGSDDWFSIRCGKFTASVAETISVAGTGLETLCFKIVAEKLTGNKEETYLLTFEPRPDMKLAVESFGGLPEEDVVTSQVKTVNVRFNKPIDASTFTADDVTLTCQGRQVDLSSMVISKVSDVEYALGLDEVTVEDGYYVLAVQTAAITDGEGYAGETGKNVSWTPGCVAVNCIPKMSPLVICH